MSKTTSEPGEHREADGRLPGVSLLESRLQLANRLYREFYIRCFWHCPRDLEITADLVPFVIKGLKTHGGRKGFILAAQLKDTV